jgi:hypothetical protein
MQFPCNSAMESTSWGIVAIYSFNTSIFLFMYWQLLLQSGHWLYIPQWHYFQSIHLACQKSYIEFINYLYIIDLIIDMSTTTMLVTSLLSSEPQSDSGPEDKRVVTKMVVANISIIKSIIYKYLIDSINDLWQERWIDWWNDQQTNRVMESGRQSMSC